MSERQIRESAAQRENRPSEVVQLRRGQFERGKSGNPGGRHKGVIEVIELARAESVACIESLVRLRDDPKQPGIVRLKAAEVLLDRAWGKAPAHLTLEDPREDARAIKEELRDMILKSVAEMAGVCATIKKL
jgi:hypothetical protein